MRGLSHKLVSFPSPQVSSTRFLWFDASDLEAPHISDMFRCEVYVRPLGGYMSTSSPFFDMWADLDAQLRVPL